MTLLAVSAIGADRPGIVAAVSEVLAAQACNLEDTSMTILRGHFAMTLVVDGDTNEAALDAVLQPVASALGLVLTVREIAEEHSNAEGAQPYVISVYGADHPGIVARVTRLLADRGVNITDLTTRLLDASDPPLYAMVLEVDLPAALDEDVLRAALADAARELDVDATLRVADADIL